MIRFLQPQWLWLLTLLPVVMLLRGRRGPVAAGGGEHGDDRLGQLAVPGTPGVEPGPLEGDVRGEFGD